MKSLKKVAQENPTKTWVTVVTAIIGIATLFVEQADILGVDTDVVKWVSFGIAAVSFVISHIQSKAKK